MPNKSITVRKRSATYKLVIYSLFTAILAVISPLAIPMPTGVPITLQTFALCLCGFFLGIRAVIPALVYLFLGLAGLPIFSNFTGGIAKLVGPTGGFICGFLFLALFCGAGISLSEKLLKRSYKSSISNFLIEYLIPLAFGLIGMAICHLLGIVVFSFVTDTPFIKSAILVSLRYIVKDVLSMILALVLAKTLKKRLTFVAF